MDEKNIPTNIHEETTAKIIKEPPSNKGETTVYKKVTYKTIIGAIIFIVLMTWVAYMYKVSTPSIPAKVDMGHVIDMKTVDMKSVDMKTVDMAKSLDLSIKTVPDMKQPIVLPTTTTTVEIKKVEVKQTPPGTEPKPRRIVHKEKVIIPVPIPVVIEDKKNVPDMSKPIDMGQKD